MLRKALCAIALAFGNAGWADVINVDPIDLNNFYTRLGGPALVAAQDGPSVVSERSFSSSTGVLTDRTIADFGLSVGCDPCGTVFMDALSIGHMDGDEMASGAFFATGHSYDLGIPLGSVLFAGHVSAFAWSLEDAQYFVDCPLGACEIRFLSTYTLVNLAYSNPLLGWNDSLLLQRNGRALMPIGTTIETVFENDFFSTVSPLNVYYISVTTVPEPSSFSLLAAALLFLASRRRLMPADIV